MYKTTIEAIRYWVPSKTKRNKKGEPIIFPNDVRKIFLADPAETFEPKQFTITQYRRGGQTKYSVKGLYEPKRPQWYTPLAHGPLPASQWRKAESLSRAELVAWLNKRVYGAEALVTEMETVEPIDYRELEAA